MKLPPGKRKTSELTLLTAMVEGESKLLVLLVVMEMEVRVVRHMLASSRVTNMFGLDNYCTK